jgi:hypothetical protein
MRHNRRGCGEQSKAGHEDIKLSSHRCTSQMIIVLAILLCGLAVERLIPPTDIPLSADDITALH